MKKGKPPLLLHILRMPHAIGQTPVRESDKLRFAFRTYSDTEGRREVAAYIYVLEYRGSPRKFRSCFTRTKGESMTK